MPAKTKQTTWYMHTLDGRPAVLQTHAGRTWLSYATGRTRAPLVASLTQIRRNRTECLDTCEQDYADVVPGVRNQNVRDLYDSMGYVLVRVEVPNV